jgi:hypothetical protein
VGHCIAIGNCDFGAIFAAAAEESADNAFLFCRSSEGMVEDGENGLNRRLAVLTERANCLCAYLWLNHDVDRRRGGLSASDSSGTERPRQMEE